MKLRTLAILTPIVLARMIPSVSAQDDEVVFGAVTTIHRTMLKIAPNPSSTEQDTLAENQGLRWVMGERKNNYLRVMVPRGPMGWVLESDVKKVSEPDFAGVELLRATGPCATSLNDCSTTKPTGCAAPGSADGLANQKKRTVPPAGPATILSFGSFCELQSAALKLVDMGVDIPIDDRPLIEHVATSCGVVGEGTRVRLMAFLSTRNPTADSVESVNCKLPGEPNHDIHISVTESKGQSAFEGIVAEMIPQNRPTKWTAANVGKLRSKLLLIEGGLFYDNHHIVNCDASNPVGNQPERFSLWEIHPVTSLKACKNVDGRSCDPNVESDWEDF